MLIDVHEYNTSHKKYRNKVALDKDKRDDGTITYTTNFNPFHSTFSTSKVYNYLQN